MPARRAQIQIEYLPGQTGEAGAATSGTDATRDLVPFVTSASYTDNARGRADAAELVLNDRDGRFSEREVADHPGRPAWPVLEGDRFRLSLALFDWERPGGDLVVPWGTFEVDEVGAGGGAFGSRFVVQLQSAATLGSSAGFRDTRRSESYPAGTTLGAVCARAASRNGLGLSFFAEDVALDREAVQQDKPDSTFVKDLCRRYGLDVSVREVGRDGGVRIVVSDEGGLADQDAVAVTPDQCERWEFGAAVHRRFEAARCSYYDPRKGEVVEALVKADGYDDNSETLQVQATVGSKAEAERIARAALRDRNRGRFSGRLVLAPGSPAASAGSVVEPSGFGRYDGRYLVDEARHRYTTDFGYTTELRLVLVP